MCPKCQCEKRVKNGVLNGKQRYKCKQCGCNYTMTYQENAEKEKKRRFALSMYLEGLGFHSIGRLLGVSHASVINWVRKYGQNLSDIRNDKPVKIIELDELHTYIQHKKYLWVWIAADRNEREFIDFVVGDRSSQTGVKLWQSIENESVDKVFSDFWKSYKEIIPCEKLHQSKAETFTIEGFNSLIRHYLARFRRKTKCYTKSL